MFELSKMTQATKDFQKYVEPQLYTSGLFDPKVSYVIICEGEKDDLKSRMDKYAGIDMCTVDTQNQVIQGVASRVQYCQCFRTFTIRTITDNGSFDTELKKRSRAIKNGDMYPTWTTQAYVYPDPTDPDKMICTVGIVRTVDLFNYALEHLENEHFTTKQDFYNALQCWSSIGELGVRKNYIGGAVFLSCDWDLMKQHGIPITILEGVFDK